MEAGVYSMNCKKMFF